MDYVKLMSGAFAVPYTAERPSGCGRVYVIFSPHWNADDATRVAYKEHIKGIDKAAKKLGKLFQRKAHYGFNNALYIGYDNADGKALGQGTAIVEFFKAAGINCYRDEGAD